MAASMIGPKFYGWSKNGQPLAGGKLYTYEARTNVPKPTYKSEDQVVENDNPVILNGEGYADVYLDGSYKMVLKDDKENEIWTSDPVSSASATEWVGCKAVNYLNPTTFTFTGNGTDLYQKDRTVRIDNNTAEYIYTRITESTYGGGITTVVVSGTVITTGIENTCVSIVGPDSLLLPGVVAKAESLQELADYPVKTGDSAYLNSGGRSGHFNWSDEDLSAEVASDTFQGVYVAPSSDLTGASGAWVRDLFPGEGVVEFAWFGGDEVGVDGSLIYIELLNNEKIKGCNFSGKEYDFNTAVSGTRNSGFITKGAGIGETIIKFNHFGNGIRIDGNGIDGDLDTNIDSISFEDLTVCRPDYESYTGGMSPKGIYVSHTNNSHFLRVEEKNAIGFGLQFDRSRNVGVLNCYVHDHFGGADGPSGTDGIHFYRCHDYKVDNCLIERVGDDAMSSGSFETDVNQQSVNGIYSNNTVRHCYHGAGAKVYSFARNIKIFGNTFEYVRNGGVYLTNDANSPDGSRVEDVDIFDNEFFYCGGDGGNISGALRFRLWNGVGTESALIKNINFHDNYGRFNRCILSAISFDENKYVENLYIRDNDFSEFYRLPTATGGTEFGIRIIHCLGRLNIVGNVIDDSLGIGVHLESQNGSYNPDWSGAKVLIKDNQINNYGAVLTGSRGIFSRPSNKRMIVDIIGNVVTNQNVADGQSGDRAILTGSIISPKSIVQGNSVDGSSSGISINSGAVSAYKGDITNKVVSTVPTTGTHYKGSRISTSNYTNGEPSVIACNSSGTFGSLVGITASTTAGEKEVVLSDASDVAPGEFITVGASFVSSEIISIEGNVLIMNDDSTSTEAAAVVDYAAPSFKAESVWSDT